MNSRPVLVLGATGMLGRPAVQCLISHGRRVRVLERFYATCHPQLRVMRMKLWQARLIARITRRPGLTYVTRLIDYFDRVVELGDPAEANALLGAPSITLDDWFALPHDKRKGLPH